MRLYCSGSRSPGYMTRLPPPSIIMACIPGDLLPLQYNLKVPYVGAIDLDPATTMKWKRWLQEKMLKEHWILAFDHDIRFKFATLELDGGGKPKLVDYPA